MTAIKLRPYQQQFITDVRNEFMQGNKHVVGVAPCGAGKTIMTGWMIRESAYRGKRSIFFVHRQELIEQTSKTFTDLDIPHGIIAADSTMQLNLPVQIASVQTLARRINKIPKPDFLICDECHHILANTYKKIINAFPDAYLLGVTATPLRTGGITLCDVFQSMVESLSVGELIHLGNLTPFHYFAPKSNVNLNGVRTKFGEYVNSDLERVMSGKVIIGDIVDTYKRRANDKSAICYCVNVNHSQLIAKSFRDAGIAAEHVDGETPKAERSRIVDDFRAGKIKVLCNAELFGEGFDVPRCQAVILARPTKSLTLYVQQSMRAMRPDPNNPDKCAIIIDHVENYKRHGFPNTNHHWSLEPNKDKQEGEAPYKICPDCSEVVFAGVRICPTCGYEFPFATIQNVEGTLAQINTPQDKKDTADKSRIKRAFTKPEEFLSIAKDRNYQIGWVAHQSLKFAASYDDCIHIAEVCGYKPGWAWHQWQDISNSKEA